MLFGHRCFYMRGGGGGGRGGRSSILGGTDYSGARHDDRSPSVRKSSSCFAWPSTRRWLWLWRGLRPWLGKPCVPCTAARMNQRCKRKTATPLAELMTEVMKLPWSELGMLFVWSPSIVNFPYTILSSGNSGSLSDSRVNKCCQGGQRFPKSSQRGSQRLPQCNPQHLVRVQDMLRSTSIQTTKVLEKAPG